MGRIPPGRLPLLVRRPAVVLLAALACFTNVAPSFAAALNDFVPRVDYPTGPQPFATAIADLNGDGRLDIATSNMTGNSVSILLSTGGGGFGTNTDFQTGGSAIGLSVADLNGDGRPDIAVSIYGGARVMVLWNTGNGIFNSSTAFATAGGGYSVATGDLNGDGIVDIVAADGGNNTVSVLFGNGVGDFPTRTTFPTGGAALDVVIADMNSDGKPDLVTANFSANTISVLLGNGSGGFPTRFDSFVGPSPWSVAVGDLNEDGKPDVVATNNSSGSISVLLGDGTGKFSSRNDYLTPPAPSKVRIADMDGDAHLDVVLVSVNANTMTIFPGSGLGTLAARRESFTGTNPQGVSIGDLNGDGALDVVTANQGAASASVFIQAGPSAAVELTSSPNPSEFGQPVTLTATLTPALVSGTVDFVDGTQTIATSSIANGVAVAQTSLLARGPHSLSARYGLSSSPVITHLVNQLVTATTLRSSLNPTLAAQSVRFTAKVAPTPFVGSPIPIGTVQFKLDGAAFGTPVPLSADSAVSQATTALSMGSHDVQAIYASGDANFAPSTSPILVQVVASSNPVIVAVRDVPNDEGGRVHLTWRCQLDEPGVTIVTGYRIWRRVPSPGPGLATTTATTPVSYRSIAGARADASLDETFWEAIANLPSAQLVSYGYTAETSQDSIAGSNPRTALFVQALTADPFVSYSSAPDSGYSVDNLAPPLPIPFTASFTPSSVSLHWTRGRADDLREFRLYRGVDLAFEPGPGSLILATRDTGYVDAVSGGHVYKLVAIDVHGNASRPATVTPVSPVATLASLVGIETAPDLIRLTWYAGGADLVVTLQRRTEPGEWSTLGTLTTNGTGYLIYEDRSVAPGERYGYRLAIVDAGSEVFTGETWAVAERMELALAGARPNPSRASRLTIQFTLPAAGSATLDLLDVSGRRIASREVGGLGAGPHAIDLGSGGRIEPGIYMVRLRQAGAVRTRRVTVLN
jgi:Bacterial Ig-like domain (group 3)/FG-GAP-like repeat